MKKRLFHFESRQQGLLSWGAFLWRLFTHFVAASSFIGVSLLVGMMGYHHFENMAWIDAFANAAMQRTLLTHVSTPKAYSMRFPKSPISAWQRLRMPIGMLGIVAV